MINVGNWVLVPTNDKIKIPCFPKKVKAITLFGELDFTEPQYPEPHIVGIKHCSGIPLTDEILTNSGFEMVKSKYPIPTGSISFVLDDFDLDKCDEGYRFGVEDEIGNNSIFVDFLYVHQLQNFYLAVRNKELNTNI